MLYHTWQLRIAYYDPDMLYHTWQLRIGSDYDPDMSVSYVAAAYPQLPRDDPDMSVSYVAAAAYYDPDMLYLTWQLRIGSVL